MFTLLVILFDGGNLESIQCSACLKYRTDFLITDTTHKAHTPLLQSSEGTYFGPCPAAPRRMACRSTQLQKLLGEARLVTSPAASQGYFISRKTDSKIVQLIYVQLH